MDLGLLTEARREWVTAIMTYSRLGLIVPFLYGLLADTTTYGRELAAVMIVAIVFLDIIDGRLADIWGVDTPRRRMVDNIMDKVLVHTAFAATVVLGMIPFWYYVPLLLRDSLVVGLGAVARNRLRAVVFPNLVHKLAMFGLAIAGIEIVLGYGSAYLFLLGSYCFLYVTALDYAGLFAQFMVTEVIQMRSGLRGYRPRIFEGLLFLLGIFKVQCRQH